jgi:hypothetical protein
MRGIRHGSVLKSEKPGVYKRLVPREARLLKSTEGDTAENVKPSVN